MDAAAFVAKSNCCAYTDSSTNSIKSESFCSALALSNSVNNNDLCCARSPSVGVLVPDGELGVRSRGVATLVGVGITARFGSGAWRSILSVALMEVLFVSMKIGPVITISSWLIRDSLMSPATMTGSWIDRSLLVGSCMHWTTPPTPMSKLIAPRIIDARFAILESRTDQLIFTEGPSP